MLSIILTVLLAALVAWICFMIVDQIGVPYPANMIAKAIVGILAVLFILQKSGLLTSLT